MMFRFLVLAIIPLLQSPLLFAQEYDTLTMDTAISIPPVVTSTSKTGGILAIKGTALPYLVGNKDRV